MQAIYDSVYTMTDFWDGPRGGVASYQGKPHVYQALFDYSSDDWEDIYLLQAIDQETLQLALEDWAIWERWEAAFHAGRTTSATHPALPEDSERHQALQAYLSERLRVDPSTAIRVTAEFHARDAEGIYRVRWKPLSAQIW